MRQKENFRPPWGFLGRLPALGCPEQQAALLKCLPEDVSVTKTQVEAGAMPSVGHENTYLGFD